MPTRVIDVGTTQAPIARLVETDGHEGVWAALSYCWGGVEQLHLNSDNIEWLKNSIPTDGLAATTRDALVVARYMGIRYVWVDAICILQDSTEDWNRQASNMRRYYSDSLVVICASSAVKADAGLTTRTHSDRIIHLPTQTRSSVFRGCQVAIGSGSKDMGVEYDKLTGSPHSTRGWCLQELALAPRVLYFTDVGLAWECNSMLKQEKDKFPDKLIQPGSRDTAAAIMFKQTVFAKAGGTYGRLESIKGLQPRTLWNIILQEYTGRQLTVRSDVLPALSGLAQGMSLLMKCKYHAGLWETDFISQLLWRRHPVSPFTRDQEVLNADTEKYDNRDTRVPLKYAAPSWSWAAVTGSVVTWEPTYLYDRKDKHCDYRYELTERQQYDNDTSSKEYNNPSKGTRASFKACRIVSINSVPAKGADSFGAVESGTLVLQGRFIGIPPPEEMPGLVAEGKVKQSNYSGIGRLISLLASEHYSSWGYYHMGQTYLHREYTQQHNSYDGQRFALFELGRWEVRHALWSMSSKGNEKNGLSLEDQGAYLLVLESKEPSRQGDEELWRRIGLLRIGYTAKNSTVKPAYEDIISKMAGWSEKQIKIV
jgi:hypothetical protein